jgi:hypothetical protein
MPAIKQDRRLAVARGELETTGCSLIGSSDFRDDAGKRAVAQAVLGHGQHLGILGPLRVEDPVRTESDLLEPGGIKVETRESPQHGKAWPRCEPRRDTGGEQGRCRIVAHPGRSGRDLVKADAVETVIGKPAVERFDAELERRPLLRAHASQLGAKRRKLLGACPIWAGSCFRHRLQRLTCSLYVPMSLPVRQASCAMTGLATMPEQADPLPRAAADIHASPAGCPRANR